MNNIKAIINGLFSCLIAFSCQALAKGGEGAINNQGALAEEGCFKNFKEAGNVFTRSFTTDGNWLAHSVSRGGSTTIIDESVVYNDDSEVVGRSFTKFNANHSGTLMAYPVGDFVELFKFRYKDGRKIKDGLIVGVKVQISNANSCNRSSAIVGRRLVEGMVNSGASLSPSVGSKPCRILPVKRSAMKRFGAGKVMVVYDATKGYVLFVLGDINEKKIDKTFIPATPQGMGAGERLQQKTIAMQEDKGGFIFEQNATVYYPAGGDPEYYKGLYEKGIK